MLLKTDTIDGYAYYNHVITGPDLHRTGPWHFGDIRNIFLPNIGEDQKKSCDISVWLIAGTASFYGKSGPD